MAYKLKLPLSSHIHPIFHVSQLKNYIAGREIVVKDLPASNWEGIINVQPKQVPQQRTILHGNHPVDQVFISLKDCVYICQQFPDLNLEDKIVAKGEGLVRKPLKMYHRKKGKMESNGKKKA